MASFWKGWQQYVYDRTKGPRPERSPWVTVRTSQAVKRGIKTCAWSDSRSHRDEEDLVSMVHGAYRGSGIHLVTVPYQEDLASPDNPTDTGINCTFSGWNSPMPGCCGKQPAAADVRCPTQLGGQLRLP